MSTSKKTEAGSQIRQSCPHCGGINGMTYTARLTTKRWVSWDGETDEEIDMSCMTTPARGTCQDCGKKAAIRSAS